MPSVNPAAVPGARFVDPKVLARIGNLELVARSVVDGFINGLHRSPYFGASVDFAEHRGYVPGDDIRRVDWRLYARTDRYYIKEYEADSNSNFAVLLDVSRSMGFGSAGDDQARLRPHARRLPHLPRAQAARPGRPRRLRPRHRRVRAAVGQAHGHGAARARPAHAVKPRVAPRADEQGGGALRPARGAGADLGPLRGARLRFSRRLGRCASAATT